MSRSAISISGAEPLPRNRGDMPALCPCARHNAGAISVHVSLLPGLLVHLRASRCSGRDQTRFGYIVSNAA